MLPINIIYISDLSQLIAIQQQRRIPFINTNEIKQLNQQQQQQQQQMVNNNPLGGYYGNSTNYQQIAPPGVVQVGNQNSKIITSPSQQRTPISIQIDNNNSLASTTGAGSGSQKAPPSSLEATTQVSVVDLFQPSTQTYWASNERLLGLEEAVNNNQCLADSNNNNALECNLKGFCDKTAAICSCFPGFSGPTCAIGKSRRPFSLFYFIYSLIS